MVVPPRIWSMSELWHCSIAIGSVMCARESTVCEELMVWERLSLSTLLFNVQKILPGTHQDWHITSMLDPTSTYRSLGTTLHFLSSRPARDNNEEKSSACTKGHHKKGINEVRNAASVLVICSYWNYWYKVMAWPSFHCGSTWQLKELLKIHKTLLIIILSFM